MQVMLGARGSCQSLEKRQEGEVAGEATAQDSWEEAAPRHTKEPTQKWCLGIPVDFITFVCLLLTFQMIS